MLPVFPVISPLAMLPMFPKYAAPLGACPFPVPRMLSVLRHAGTARYPVHAPWCWCLPYIRVCYAVRPRHGVLGAFLPMLQVRAC